MLNKVWVVEEQDNPSTDYFVLPALRRLDAEVIRCGFNELPDPDQLDGASVVFVRYVPAPWRRLVDAARDRFSGVYYFMDDDLLDFAATAGLPWRYRFKLARLATLQRGWLAHTGARLWVSNPYLQQKYSHWQPQIILPEPLEPVAEPLRIFYHGSASHGAEIHWLYPVIEGVMDANERVLFEIIGGQQVYRQYRRLPRVSVLHPLSWRSYQAVLSAPGRHIGLVPQLDQPFNLARSYTKFFDITRSGSVGIYAQGSACADMVADGVEGLVREMEPDAWVQAILQLAEDARLRESLYQNAVNKVASVKGRA